MSAPQFKDGPLLGFDLETTGVDVFEDRIVTATLIYWADAGTAPVIHEWLVNPGIPIPEGASRVHGITDEIAQSRGKAPHEAVGQIVAGIKHYMAMSNTALVIFNAAYDTSLLREECYRNGIEPIADDALGPVIDPMVIDKQADKYRKGSRKLIDVARHYGVTLTEEEAHTSTGDVKATLMLARALPVVEPRLDVTAENMHLWQIDWKAQQAASYQSYLRKSDPNAYIDGNWPIVGKRS